MSKKLISGICVGIATAAIAVVAIISINKNVGPGSGANSGSGSSKKALKQITVGTDFLEAFDYESAIAAFEEVLSVDIFNFEASLGLAKAYEALGDYSTAAYFYEKAISIDNNSAEAYLGAAKNHMLNNNPSAALVDALTGYAYTGNSDLEQLYYEISANPAVSELAAGLPAPSDAALKEKLNAGSTLPFLVKENYTSIPLYNGSRLETTDKDSKKEDSNKKNSSFEFSLDGFTFLGKPLMTYDDALAVCMANSEFEGSGYVNGWGYAYFDFVESSGYVDPSILGSFMFSYDAGGNLQVVKKNFPGTLYSTYFGGEGYFDYAEKPVKDFFDALDPGLYDAFLDAPSSMTTTGGKPFGTAFLYKDVYSSNVSYRIMGYDKTLNKSAEIALNVFDGTTISTLDVLIFD